MNNARHLPILTTARTGGKALLYSAVQSETEVLNVACQLWPSFRFSVTRRADGQFSLRTRSAGGQWARVTCDVNEVKSDIDAKNRFLTWGLEDSDDGSDGPLLERPFARPVFRDRCG